MPPVELDTIAVVGAVLVFALPVRRNPEKAIGPSAGPLSTLKLSTLFGTDVVAVIINFWDSVRYRAPVIVTAGKSLASLVTDEGTESAASLLDSCTLTEVPRCTVAFIATAPCTLAPPGIEPVRTEGTATAESAIGFAPGTTTPTDRVTPFSDAVTVTGVSTVT